LTLVPVVSPGLLSPMKLYSGWPLYSTCMVPPPRSNVSSVPLTPLPAVGVAPAATVSAGHAPEQSELVQAEWPAESESNSYSVMPLGPTRYEPSLDSDTVEALGAGEAVGPLHES